MDETQMRCKCGGVMVPHCKYRRLVYYLYRGPVSIRANSMRCLECKKCRVEELEDVPVGSKYAWDVIERMVTLKKSGHTLTEIGRLMRIENQLHISNTTVARIIMVYGVGTL